MSGVKDQIVEHIRGTVEPALSASELSNELDEPLNEIEAALGDLIDENQVQATEIGSETAYYIKRQDHPPHKKPDHHCAKCGREVHDNRDSARIAFEQYFTAHIGPDEVVQRKVVCRFCYHDFMSWLHNDEELMHVYPHLDEWDVPEQQVEAAERDPNLETSYPSEE